MDCSKKLQFKENTFAGIHCQNVIEHMGDPLSFMKEIERILAPGGKAVILTCDYTMVSHTFFWNDYTHVRPFTPVSLKMVAKDAGFTKIKVYHDFKRLPGVGLIIRKCNVPFATLRRVQRLFFMKSYTLILEVQK